MRTSFRTYTLILCGFYLMLVFMFHSRLQYNNMMESAVAMTEHEGRPLYMNIGGGSPVIHNHSHATRSTQSILHSKLNDTIIKYKGTILQKIQLHEKISKVLPATNPPDSEEKFFKQNNSDLHKTACAREFIYKRGEAHFQEVVKDAFLFSAYLDRRKATPFIRIMAVIQGRPNLYCHFQIGGADNHTIKHHATELVYYEMCENHGRPYKGYIISCPVPVDVAATQVCSVQVSASSVARPIHKLPHVILQVRHLDQQPNSRQFGVCVPPLFGPIDKNIIIEFIELSRILGAEHITFYDFDIQPQVLKVLKHYQKQKFVTVVAWKVPRHVDKKIWYHGQLISIEDCLYRNMGSVEHVAFNDIDEFMIPRVENTWNDMLKSIHKDINCGYCFQSAFFDPSRAAGSIANNRYSYLNVMRNINRSLVFSKIRTKCLVEPRKIFEMGIHHISKPNEENYKVVKLDTNKALLHHYRTCLPNFGMTCIQFVTDSRVHRYGARLHQLVQRSYAAVVH